MKSLITLSVSLFSSALLAMPAVGDMATYKILADGYDIVQKQELVSYNSSTGSFTKVTTNLVFGQESTTSEVVAVADLNTDAELNQLLAYCSHPQIGGKLETVSVPAGTFNTCAISEGSQKANLGVVPFGLVRFSDTNATVELVSYKLGK
jgi:hypothetical protein